MMKNKMYAGALFCALAMMASCSNEEAVTGNVQPQGFSLKAEMGTAQTRTTVTEDYKVNWSAGDKIYVYGTDVYATFPLTAGSGSTAGTFSGTLKGSGGIENLQYALYPAPKSYPEESGSYTITLPAAYTYGDPSNSPMYAIFGDDKGSITFEHLCAMIRFTIKGIPSEGVKTLTLSSEDLNIAGDATVTETGGAFSLTAPTAEGKSVSISIPDGTPMAAEEAEGLTFDIPLPAGSYTKGIKVSITKDGDSEFLAEKTVNNIVLEAGEILVMEPLEIISITGNTSDLVEVKYAAAVEELVASINEGYKCIRLTESITFNDETTLDGKGVILKGSPIYFKGNATVQNVTFENGHNSSGNGSSVYVPAGNSKNITFENCTFTNAEWDCIQLTNKDIESVTIKDCTFKNTVQGYRYIHLELRDGNQYAVNETASLTITGCTFENVSTDYCKDSAITITGFKFDNMTIEDNVVKGAGADNLTSNIIWICDGNTFSSLMSVEDIKTAFKYVP